MARNRYPGTCYRCNKQVAVGEGHFERHYFWKRWRTQHADCAITARSQRAKGVGADHG